MKRQLGGGATGSGLTAERQEEFIRLELARKRNTKTASTEAKLTSRSLRRSGRKSTQQRHHAFLLDPPNRTRIEAIVARVTAVMAAIQLSTEFSHDDKEFVMNWIDEVDLILTAFLPCCDPRRDPLGRMVDKLSWLQHSHTCLAEAGVDAKVLVATWERDGVLDSDGSDDDDDEGTTHLTEQISFDDMEADSEFARKERLVRRKAAARIIRRNVQNGSSTSHWSKRVEEFRLFGNTFYKDIDTPLVKTQTMKLLTDEAKAAAVSELAKQNEASRTMRLNNVMHLAQHVATFKVDDAIRNVAIALQKRRLLEHRCAVKLQLKWRAFKVSKAKMMLLLEELRRRKKRASSIKPTAKLLKPQPPAPPQPLARQRIKTPELQSTPPLTRHDEAAAVDVASVKPRTPTGKFVQPHTPPATKKPKTPESFKSTRKRPTVVAADPASPLEPSKPSSPDTPTLQKAPKEPQRPSPPPPSALKSTHVGVTGRKGSILGSLVSSLADEKRLLDTAQMLKLMDTTYVDDDDDGDEDEDDDGRPQPSTAHRGYVQSPTSGIDTDLPSDHTFDPTDSDPDGLTADPAGTAPRDSTSPRTARVRRKKRSIVIPRPSVESLPGDVSTTDAAEHLSRAEATGYTSRAEAVGYVTRANTVGHMSRAEAVGRISRAGSVSLIGATGGSPASTLWSDAPDDGSAVVIATDDMFAAPGDDEFEDDESIRELMASWAVEGAASNVLDMGEEVEYQRRLESKLKSRRALKKSALMVVLANSMRKVKQRAADDVRDRSGSSSSRSSSSSDEDDDDGVADDLATQRLRLQRYRHETSTSRLCSFGGVKLHLRATTAHADIVCECVPFSEDEARKPKHVASYTSLVSDIPPEGEVPEVAGSPPSNSATRAPSTSPAKSPPRTGGPASWPNANLDSLLSLPRLPEPAPPVVWTGRGPTAMTTSAVTTTTTLSLPLCRKGHDDKTAQPPQTKRQRVRSNSQRIRGTSPTPKSKATAPRNRYNRYKWANACGGDAPSSSHAPRLTNVLPASHFTTPQSPRAAGSKGPATAPKPPGPQVKSPPAVETTVAALSPSSAVKDQLEAAMAAYIGMLYSAPSTKTRL